MEEVKNTLRELESALQESKHDEKTSKLIQNFIGNLEKEIDNIFVQESEIKDELEFTYFLNVLKGITSNEQFLETIEPEKIERTLLAALPNCGCPPQVRPCPAETQINLFVSSFLEQVSSLEQ